MASLAKRGRGGKGRRTMNEINMVPFIDVMLVLLIIFMVTAPLISPSMISLPSVGQAARQPDRFVQVIIDSEGALSVRTGNTAQPPRQRGGAGTPQDPDRVSLEGLVARVRELQGTPATADPAAQTPVVISADKNVKYETVVATMDRLQRAGIARVGLSVQTTP
ncbi:MAG: biopolymer transporter ExbD [Serpentinimonas sp.]|jgi:biopolymer transport protein TolR|nr:biopolymer transporter ExbD [Serpentinimonas sp.]